jgi:DNA invertase Pin-like site-specific DNA recombinase
MGSQLPRFGMTGRNRNRPGLQQALAAVRAGDTLVVPKLDRLARSPTRSHDPIRLQGKSDRP